MSVSIRCLYDGPWLCVNEFRCSLDDTAWSEPNEIHATGPLIVFPRLPVLIRHEHDEPVLATPNVAMLYRPGEIYEREARDPRGDDCLYLRIYDGDVGRVTHVPTSSATYLRQHALACYLRRGNVDALLVETTAAALVADVLGAGAVRRATEPHRRLAAAAKELLAETVAESPSLHELATELHVSPFHLARVFRRVTGYGLHEYRRQLRLRLALERLPKYRGSLTQLAFELGFASHSHFTEAFRLEFGMAPSTISKAEAAHAYLASLA